MLLGGYVDESKTKDKMLPKDIFLRKFVLRDTIPNFYKNSHKTLVFKLEANNRTALNALLFLTQLKTCDTTKWVASLPTMSKV